jgi:hypothetical protein
VEQLKQTALEKWPRWHPGISRFLDIITNNMLCVDIEKRDTAEDLFRTLTGWEAELDNAMEAAATEQTSYWKLIHQWVQRFWF